MSSNDVEIKWWIVLDRSLRSGWGVVGGEELLMKENINESVEITRCERYC